jgi:hypothetical protein
VYYTTYNDGIDWHNYWRLGYENSGTCSANALHVSYYFPQWMQDLLQSGSQPGTITEADLFSYPWQDNNQPLQDKDRADGTTAADSVRAFFYNELRAQVVVAWLLNDWSANPNNHNPNPEHDWHEAYGSENEAGAGVVRRWFARWWPCSERLATPVVTATRWEAYVYLSWSAVPNATAYDVYRWLNDPYFTPVSPYVTVYGTAILDPVLGDVNIHHFYFVRAINSYDSSCPSNRAGEFEFALVPGTP